MSWAACFVASILLVGGTVRQVRADPEAARRLLDDRVALGLVALALAARLAMPGYFVHSNFHGPQILDELVDLPHIGDSRAYFGQTSFVVVGTLSSLFVGNAWLGVRVVDALLSTLGLAAGAWWAGRLAGPDARRATLALGALHPLFVRVAASEDAHSAGLAFGMVALAVATHLRESRWTGPALAVLTGATVLAAHARHSFLGWPAFMVAVLVPWTRLETVDRRAIVRWGALAAVLLAPRYLERFFFPAEGASFSLLSRFLMMLTEPAFVAGHPLVRLDESAAFTPFAVLGFAWVAVHRSWVGLLTAASAVALSLVSFGFNMHPSYNEEYAFRVADFGLLVALGGLGGALVMDGVRRVAPALGGVGLAAMTLAPLPGLLRVAADVDPLHEEHLLLRQTGAVLPPGSVVWDPLLGDPEQSIGWVMPRRPLFEAGMQPIRTNDDVPYGVEHVYMFQSSSCFAWSIVEVHPGGVDGFVAGMVESDDEGLLAYKRMFWSQDGELFRSLGVEPPTGMRPACQELAGMAEAFIPLGEVHVGRQLLPHAWYTADVVPIGFWRMPAGFEPVRDLPKALIGEVPVRTRPPPPPPMPERPPPGPDQNPPWW